jgi:hypothetical protein
VREPREPVEPVDRPPGAPAISPVEYVRPWYLPSGAWLGGAILLCFLHALTIPPLLWSGFGWRAIFAPEICLLVGAGVAVLGRQPRVWNLGLAAAAVCVLLLWVSLVVVA